MSGKESASIKNIQAIIDFFHAAAAGASRERLDRDMLSPAKKRKSLVFKPLDRKSRQKASAPCPEDFVQDGAHFPHQDPFKAGTGATDTKLHYGHQIPGWPDYSYEIGFFLQFAIQNDKGGNDFVQISLDQDNEAKATDPTAVDIVLQRQASFGSASEDLRSTQWF